MQTFVRTLLDVALEFNGGNLSYSKRTKLIETYNKKEGSVFERALSAIEEVTGKKIPSDQVIEKTASLSNLKNLLSKMELTIDEWQTPKK